MKRLILILSVLLLAFSISLAENDTSQNAQYAAICDQAWDAFDAGEYGEVITMLEPLLEDGYAEAQYLQGSTISYWIRGGAIL